MRMVLAMACNSLILVLLSAFIQLQALCFLHLLPRVFDRYWLFKIGGTRYNDTGTIYKCNYVVFVWLNCAKDVRRLFASFFTGLPANSGVSNIHAVSRIFKSNPRSLILLMPVSPLIKRRAISAALRPIRCQGTEIVVSAGL